MLPLHAAKGAAPSLEGPVVPQRVGRYEILLPIASGGMATVYLARTVHRSGFQRQVALKLTHAHLRENEGFAADLLEEAKLGARIRHQNIVPVSDVGDDPHGVYLVMEYVEGETLSRLVRIAERTEERLPVRVSLRILVDALAGLHAAHELRDDETGELLGLVHRDFSPQNVLVDLDGVSLLADFGVAKATTRLQQTQTGCLKGKIHYMPPEQVRGDAIDRRCDVWSAGIIAWELLAGRSIYQDTKNDTAMVLDIVSKAPPLLRSVNPEVPRALEEVVARALEMDPHRRCGTAAEFAKILTEAATGEYALASPAEVAEQVRRLVGPALARRRERVVEVARLRAQMGEIASEEVADASVPGSGQIALGASAYEESGLSAQRSGVAPASSAVRLVDQDEIRTRIENLRPRRARPIAAFAGIGALVLAGVALTWRSVAPTAASPAAPTSEPAPAASAAPTSVPLASLPDAPAASAQVAPAKTLTITANAHIASLQVGKRLVTIPSPTATLTIDLAPDEASRPEIVYATSTDGRRTQATLPAGGGTLDVQFPGRATAGSATPRPAAPTPIPPSPYEAPAPPRGGS